MSADWPTVVQPGSPEARAVVDGWAEVEARAEHAWAKAEAQRERLRLVEDQPDATVRELARQADAARRRAEAPAAREQAPEGLRAHLLRRAQLGDLPQPEPLIVDTLDRRTVALLAGRNSTGKSFLALDWACCVATGHPWQGRAVPSPGPVLYVAAEGAYGLHQRVSAWEQVWRRDVEDLDVMPVAVNFFSGGDVPALVDLVRERAYRLVVVDTWARSTVGGVENSNTDSTISFANVDRLRRLDTTVLLVAHTDATDSKARGATALEDNCDSVYRMSGDALYVQLSRTKRKDGPREDEHALSLLTVDLGTDLRTGDSTTSCVIQNAIRDSGHVTPRAAELLALFADTFPDTGATKNDLRQVAGQAPATFARSMSALVRTGALVNTGTDQRPFYKLGNASA